MNNVTLMPFAGLILGGYCGVELYDHLVDELILKHSNATMLMVAGGIAFAGLVIGYLWMIKLERLD